MRWRARNGTHGLHTLRRMAPGRREDGLAGCAAQAPGLRRDAIRRNRRAPYVNSADQSEAVPFPDIGDRYVLAGAQCGPQVLVGLSQAQTASQLRNPDSPVAKALAGHPT